MRKLVTVLILGLVSLSLVGAQETDEERQLRLARQLSLDDLEAERLARALAETEGPTPAELREIEAAEELARVERLSAAEAAIQAKERTEREAKATQAAIEQVRQFEQRHQLPRLERQPTPPEQIDPVVAFVQQLVAGRLAKSRPAWFGLFGELYLSREAYDQLYRWMQQQNDATLRKVLSYIEGRKATIRDKKSSEYLTLQEIADTIRKKRQL